MRIAIVSETPSAAHMLRSAVALKPTHRIAWTASSGAEAVALSAADTPDLILMDLLRDGTHMDSVEATRQIMARAPCAILLVTPNVHDHAAGVFKAVGSGAVDAVDMPSTSGDLQESAAALLAKINVISRLIGDDRLKTRGHAPEGRDAVTPEPRELATVDRLVAIGASAGGPAALCTLLAGLPSNFPAAIVIVQHVDEQFAAGMTEWLGEKSTLPIRVAREGDCPTRGTVLLAATCDHLVLKTSTRLGYTPDPRHYVYRPSVDVFFESLGRLWQGEIVGVLLTGMGRDGAQGLRALRNRGHHTIAQDQASSAVYGMPKAAATIDAAVDILPLDRVASRLDELISRESHSLRTIW